jgi:hypothetical protein
LRMRSSPSFFFSSSSSSFSQLFARSAHGPFQPVCYVLGYAHIITPVYTRKFSSTRRSDNHFCRAAEGLLRGDRRGGAARRGAAWRSAQRATFPRDCIYLPTNTLTKVSIHPGPLVPPRLPFRVCPPSSVTLPFYPASSRLPCSTGRSQPRADRFGEITANKCRCKRRIRRRRAGSA